MAKAVRCPVCDGKGEYNKCEYKTITTIGPAVTCHGCGGKGWVEVAEANPEWPRSKWIDKFTVWAAR